jgi:hypothetical protein
MRPRTVQGQPFGTAHTRPEQRERALGAARGMASDEQLMAEWK